ncbi:HSPB (Heat shock 27kDa) associated protein 1 [Seminavis robusta]|uniref:HSPB (Heat shock 27kDa) associated protein 1 n=1 Tax=Seminavis robusta TaxID=568900 RepID=A0A9N8EPU4_9STRA|nr:HSPB (Heat shock 27kDa) associated protein 1 [Seminavis robusta]|eukprot:Sro1398_g269250.1 HSPB (Heat shock 27kDa) associated protein 1 (479) ;mRNA; f:9567-11003
MRQRNETAVRQRTAFSSLEVAQGRPSDDGDFRDSNRKLLATKSNKSKRQRQRKRDKLLNYWRHLRLALGESWRKVQPLLRIAWKRVLRMTAIEIIVVVVSLIFLGFPLLLFAFSERKVIQEHAIHYDIYNCPAKPPQGYPRAYPILDVLHHWEIDSLSIPQRINKGLCVFDLDSSENGLDDISIRQKIQQYRQEEAPFVIRNDPQVLQAAQRWARDDYLNTKLADSLYPATLVSIVGNDTIANSTAMMSFPAWSQQAHTEEALQFVSLRLPNTEFLQEELSFFRPQPQFADRYHTKKKTNDKDLLLYDVTAAGGIQCDFQSPGFRVEETLQMADSSGSYIAVLSGSSRYMLVHPKECKTIYLESKRDEDGHYSSRIHLNRYYNMTSHHHRTQASSSLHHHHHHHPQFQEKEFPLFHKTTMTEVVLEMGDVLYLPTHWFRYSVTVQDSPSYQCKVHSDSVGNHKYHSMVHDCLKKVKKA